VSHAPSTLRLSEVVSALSYALDVTDGQDVGHAVRSCVIGMRLSEELGLAVTERSALFYGLLLKDAGCSSNAAKVSALYKANDHQVKRGVKTINHKRIPEALGYVWGNVGGRGPRRMATAASAIIRGPRIAKEMTAIRCERGAEIVRMLDLPEDTVQAVLNLDEHWDGRGHPAGHKGDEIPMLARILNLSQVVEVFLARQGLDAAFDVAHERSGTWFDPAVVEALDRIRDASEFWGALAAGEAELQVATLEPPDRVIAVDDDRLDRVAEAFALVIDAKSPYTFLHSARVAELALAAGATLGMTADELRDLRRAGLLHDLGKLAISNRILDKPGPLDADEFALVREHPTFTRQILGRIPAFAELAPIAAAHHEKLDGSGYPLGLEAHELSSAARILVVADIFEALTADRPYRAAMSTAEALALMLQDVDQKLCGVAFAALSSSCESVASQTARAPLQAA
jgi:HD-GYP domain-containing protein (c-di-GMP phosphodiesterase class II)